MLEFFETVGRFISMIVNGISTFFTIVTTGFSYVTSFFNFLPAPLVAVLVGSLTVMIAIGIIKLI